MNPAEMIVAIVALVMIAGVLRARYASHGAARDSAPPAASPDAARLADEVRELRARIHVLERAITDNHGSADLTQEIERLRDR